MLYDSYEQIITRDRPAYWWRPYRTLVSPGWPSQGRPGLQTGLYTETTGVANGAAGLPGAANGTAIDTIGSSVSTGAQGMVTPGHTTPGSVLTYEIWIMPTASLVAARNYNVFTRRNANATWSGFVSVSGALNFYTNSTNGFTAADALQQMQWTHAVGITRGSDNELWVNGRRIRDVVVGAPETTGTVQSLSMSTFVGYANRPDSTLSYYSFPGRLAEPALYDYALSPSQIVEHYKAGITPRRSTSRLASVMYPFTSTVTPPGGLTAIGDVTNRRIALVSDRPR